ncbi:MAG: family 16 glycosylhydrolase [Lentisphaerae bacterium]|nr:family 16 glycosylhydrolase [Lentisphaerota bacterium]MBT4814066.1 family 16 glycosylhydrolase [Lentisphaerota bacterium]MBT5612657.1 family 16 glycosylhydrolase [Lentisphaerota bacterium]MBT7053681.1 family 16 glycosylhydrolase [Lentisphaerota bacterium]MBT7841142.1 family 16 glycosylhydrolase [Lentisphaerota bacterium]
MNRIRKALKIMCISSALLAAGCVTVDDGQPVQPVGVPGKWTLVEEFSDEFNAAEVDDVKWNRKMGAWGERAWRPDNVYTKDGKLHIRATYDPHEHKGEKYFYTMGILMSQKTTTYGYFEARIKGCSKFRGMCPGFWLFSRGKHRMEVNGETVCYSEIDIIEILQGLWHPQYKKQTPPNWIDCNLHLRLLKNGEEKWFRPNDSPEMCRNHWEAPWDPRDDYHLYAVENSKEWIVWYIDGKEVARKPNLYWHLPMNLTLTMEARPPLIRWAGSHGREPDPENCTPEGFPTEMTVDYVRSWVRTE